MEFDDKVTYYTFDKMRGDQAPGTPLNLVQKWDYCGDIFKAVVRLDNKECVLENKHGFIVNFYDKHEPNKFIDWIDDLAQKGKPEDFQSDKEWFFKTADGARKIWLSRPGFNQSDLDTLKKISSLIELKYNN